MSHVGKSAVVIEGSAKGAVAAFDQASGAAKKFARDTNRELSKVGKGEAEGGFLGGLAQRAKMMKRERRMSGEGALEGVLGGGVSGLANFGLESLGIGLPVMAGEAFVGMLEKMSDSLAKVRRGEMSMEDALLGIVHQIPLLGGLVKVWENLTGSGEQAAEQAKKVAAGIKEAREAARDVGREAVGAQSRVNLDKQLDAIRDKVNDKVEKYDEKYRAASSDDERAYWHEAKRQAMLGGNEEARRAGREFQIDNKRRISSAEASRDLSEAQAGGDANKGFWAKIDANNSKYRNELDEIDFQRNQPQLDPRIKGELNKRFAAVNQEWESSNAQMAKEEENRKIKSAIDIENQVAEAKLGVQKASAKTASEVWAAQEKEMALATEKELQAVAQRLRTEMLTPEERKKLKALQGDLQASGDAQKGRAETDFWKQVSKDRQAFTGQAGGEINSMLGWFQGQGVNSAKVEQFQKAMAADQQSAEWIRMAKEMADNPNASPMQKKAAGRLGGLAEQMHALATSDEALKATPYTPLRFASAELASGSYGGYAEMQREKDLANDPKTELAKKLNEMFEEFLQAYKEARTQAGDTPAVFPTGGL